MSETFPQQGNHQMTQEPSGTSRRLPRLIRRTLKVALPVAILLGGAGLAFGLIETGPTAERKPPTRQAKLVEVEPVQIGRRTITIEAMGTVQPNREVELRPQVGGQVIWLSDEYVPGGVLAKGDRLLKLDPRDYELVVRQKKAEVAKAESELKIEEGQQSIAKREYELLGKDIAPADSSLVLRRPQLASVEADLATAKAALAQAQLDLARTEVTVPFNAVVQSRDVNLGTQVTSSTTVATLTGTDSFLIEVAVPGRSAQMAEDPPHRPVRRDRGSGSTTRRPGGRMPFATAGSSALPASWRATGRLAQLLVAVDDPMALEGRKPAASRFC